MGYSDREIKALKWEGKDRRICVGDGLYLNIRRSSKTWIIRRRRNGITTVKTLDQYPDMTLKDATAAASVQSRKPDGSKVTVEMLADEYMRNIVQKNHKRPELPKGYIDRAILPVLGKKKVSDITRYELAILIQVYSKRGSRSADQLRSNLKTMFGYGVELGYRDDNPMNDMSCRVSGYVPQARDRVLTDEEIRLVWAEENQNAKVLRFLLLTSLRISEAQNGVREGDRWIVPKEISKNGRAHWIYLTDEAKAQLPLPKSTSTNIQAWVRRWCNRKKISPRFTPHDLRRTAATRMADNGITPFIVERVLNHTLQGVMNVYNQAEYEKERIDASLLLEQTVVGILKRAAESE